MCTSVIRVIYSWYVRLKPACFVEKSAEIMNKKGPRGLWGWWRHGWQVCCILGLVGLNWFGSLQASVLSRPTSLQQLAVPLHGYFWWSTEQWLNHTIAAPVNRYCTLIGHKIQYSTQCPQILVWTDILRRHLRKIMRMCLSVWIRAQVSELEVL